MAGPRIRVLIVGDYLGFGNQIDGAARLYRLWALHLDPERYMAMGKAIVATTLVEVLEDGVSGILIPPREPQRLVAQIVRLLENPAKARELGDNARKAVERFSVGQYMKALDQVYEATIRAHRPPASRLRHALGQVVSLAVGSKQL